MRSGSTIEFISTILPPKTVKPMTATGWPPRVMTTPAAPFTSTGCFGAAFHAIASVWKFTERVYEICYHDTTPLTGSPANAPWGAQDGGATVAS